MKLNFEQQIDKFITSGSKKLLAENLFYTASKFRFHGVVKLWLYNTTGSVFKTKDQETGKGMDIGGHNGKSGNSRDSWASIDEIMILLVLRYWYIRIMILLVLIY